MFEKAPGLFGIWVLETLQVFFFFYFKLVNTPLLAEFHRIPERSLEFTFLNLCDVVSICLTVAVGE